MIRSLAAILLLLTPLIAEADGGAFMRTIEDPRAATMPDQAALLAFDGSVETLAIQTRFIGNPSEFAWVVPLPSVPEVSACDPAVFRVLPALFPRRVVTDRGIPPLWFVSVWLVLTLVIALRFKAWWAKILVALMLLAAFVLVFAPALGQARAASGTPREPSLTVDAQVVGEFDVATLSSGTAEEVIAWLLDHQFAVNDAAKQAISAYAKEHWCFVASRSRREARATADGTVTPHPLVYRFKTSTPIYPMRLTGANNVGPLSVSLYVFGHGTAESSGWQVRRSATCEVAEIDEFDRPRRFPPTTIRVSHSALRGLIPSNATQGTCLVRTLLPSEMHEDVAITFATPREEQERIYTAEAAVAIGANIAGGVFLLLSVVSLAFKAISPARHAGWMIGASAGVSCIIGGAFVSAMPLTLSVKRPDVRSGYLLDELRRKDPIIGSMADLQSQVMETCRELEITPGNVDGPGGYMLEETSDHFRVRLIDDYGQEYRWTKTKSR